MKNETKKVTLKSRWGLIPPVTFKVLNVTHEGNYIVSYSSAKKAQRNNSGDYFPGLEIYESHFVTGGSESYALVNKEVITKNRREE